MRLVLETFPIFNSDSVILYFFICICHPTYSYYKCLTFYIVIPNLRRSRLMALITICAFRPIFKTATLIDYLSLKK